MFCIPDRNFGLADARSAGPELIGGLGGKSIFAENDTLWM